MNELYKILQSILEVVLNIQEIAKANNMFAQQSESSLKYITENLNEIHKNMTIDIISDSEPKPVGTDEDTKK